MSSFKKYFYFAASVFLLDRILKFFGFFINEGFAFGLKIGNSVSLVIALLALAFFISYIFKQGNKTAAWLILFGALSNIIDRVLYGGVVDYLSLPGGGIINLADVLIFSGIVFLFLPKNKNSGH